MIRPTTAVLRCAVPTALVAVLTAGCGLERLSMQTLAGAGGTEPVDRVTAVFTDVSRLHVGSPVRAGPVEVGRVSEIRTEDFRALVELDLHTEVALGPETTARLELVSTLGSRYVVLDPGRETSPSADGHRIPPERTSPGPTIEDTLAAVGTLLNGSGLAQMRTLVTEADAALSGRGGTVRELLSELDSVLTTLDEHRGRIRELIDSVGAVSGRLADGTPTLEAALTEITPAVETLLAERDRFTDLLDTTASLGETVRGVLDETGDALTDQVDRLRPLLTDLADVGERLGGTLAGAREFVGLLRRAAPGDYLLLDGTLDVSRSIAEILDPGHPPGSLRAPGDRDTTGRGDGAGAVPDESGHTGHLGGTGETGERFDPLDLTDDLLSKKRPR
ncbi:MCE family protein [Saccharomonospora halophila]|uniref:MCE family protein n=1 Tax=Saccharomonospora halophila TaxID=129922 RepID=UPI0003827684|nr:MCE family protein [Saccharomonospora halophila]